MMTLDLPQTIWSQRHADTLNALEHVTFAPLAMFGSMPPTASQAATSGSGSAIDEWNAAIAQKMAANGWTKQQAATALARENQELRQRYIDEYRQQAAQRT